MNSVGSRPQDRYQYRGLRCNRWNPIPKIENPDHGMSFSQPPTHAEKQLKYACEECHTRKTRCYALTDSQPGTCTPCHLNGRKCLFALKNKTGRPRRATQQSKVRSTEPGGQEWESSSMQWDRPGNLFRHHSDTTGYTAGTYDDHQLPSLPSRAGFSPPLPPTAHYRSVADIADSPPRMLDLDGDCLHGTEMTGMFQHASATFSNSSSGTSELMSQDCMGMSLVSSTADALPILPATLPSDLSSSISNQSFGETAPDSSYNQAVFLSQQIHRHYVQLQSRPIELTNKNSVTEVGQILESFDLLAHLLKQKLKTGPSGGLSGTIMSAALYVAVLQAILILKVLLQLEAHGTARRKFSEDKRGPSAMFQYLQPTFDDESLTSSSSSPQSMCHLDCILNLTKMEYYVAIFNQFLRLCFPPNGLEKTHSSHSGLHGMGSHPLVDHKACVEGTEAIQTQVRSLLVQTRQSVH